MERKMRCINRDMAVFMGLTMSLFLSLTGTLSSGHFTVVAFIMSFFGSTILSIFIGFIVPVGKISMNVDRKLGLQPNGLKARFLNSFISDLIYTPIMTLGMVVFAYMMAKKNSGGKADLSFLPMFLKSLAICFAVGYVLIFIFQPMFMNMLFKKYNIPRGMGPQQGPPQGMGR